MNSMFYPTTTIEELMPDVLINVIAGHTKLSNKNFGFTGRKKSKVEVTADFTLETVEEKRAVEVSNIEHTMEGIRGALPASLATYPTVDYSSKYGHVQLSGLYNLFIVCTPATA